MASIPGAGVPSTRVLRKRKQLDEPVAAADPLYAPPPTGVKKRKLAPQALNNHSDDTTTRPPPDSFTQKPSKSQARNATIDLTQEDDGVSTPKKSRAASQRKATAGSKQSEEKRLKKYRAKAPQVYAQYHNRAITQRMFVVDRHRHANDECPHSTPDCPMEVVDLAGTTGNVYQVTITHVPHCTCPNFQNGNPQCKHIVYVLVKVLKAPPTLQYQLAFLTSELHEIFDNAGPLPVETIDEGDKDGKRKTVEGDCPICCEDLVPESEEIVWCKAACGNNLHKTCFDQWAASKRGSRVTCPYCRTPWQTSESNMKDLKSATNVVKDGYVNIAQELGLSGLRDYSSYHSFWVRRQRRNGGLSDDADEGYGYED